MIILPSWNFTDRSLAFGAMNAAVSVGMWKATSRRILLTTGLFNSFLCVMGTTMQYEYPGLANSYVAVGSSSAAAVYGLHIARTPGLQLLNAPTVAFGAWAGFVSLFAFDRIAWSFALRNDT